MPKYKKLPKKYRYMRVRAAVMEDGDVYVLGRYNSDDQYRYEFAGGKIEHNDGKPKKATSRESSAEFNRKTIVDKVLVIITSPHSGIQNVIRGATWKTEGEKITPQRDEGFTTYRRINSQNYYKYKYNYSTEMGIMWLLKNGYLR